MDSLLRLSRMGVVSMRPDAFIEASGIRQRTTHAEKKQKWAGCSDIGRGGFFGNELGSRGNPHYQRSRCY